MSEENIIQENDKNVVEIYPLKKGRRILVFLGDFFLVFILSFLLHNVAVTPIANAINSNDSRRTEALKASNARDDILYGNKLLFYQNDATKYQMSANVSYTYDRYISYYGFDEGDVYQKDNKIGHYKENEIIAHYYGDIKDNIQTYIDYLKSANNIYNYFIIEGNEISIKNDLKKEIKLSFTSPEDVSEDGKKDLENLKNVFLSLYQAVFNDIAKNDLTFNNESYLHYQEKVVEFNKFYNDSNSITTIITFFISYVIVYILVPLINKNRKTPTMIILKIDRIGTNNLFILKRSETFIHSIFSLFFNAANLLFIPMTVVGFEGVFALSYILVFSIISFLLIFASLLTCLFSPFNRTICDMLSRTVLIREDDLDSIYRAKGYEV